MNFVKKLVITYIFIHHLFSPIISVLAQTPNNDIINIDDSSVVMEEAGTYPIKIRYLTAEGETIEEIIYITIYYPKTIKNVQYQEAIDAHDIELSQNILFDLTDEEIIRLANAHAWSLVDGKSIPITKVKREVINQKQGRYQVQFSTEYNTTITIQVLYRENIPVYSNRTSYLYFDALTTRSYYYATSAILVLLLATVFVASFYIKRLYDKAKLINELLYLQEDR